MCSFYVNLTGASDEDVLAWCQRHGHTPDEFEITTWNAYMSKLGWRDEATPGLECQIADSAYPRHLIQTIFDFIDYDEDRRNGSPLL